MTAGRMAAGVVMCALLAADQPAAQSPATAVRVTALVGLARTARDQGRLQAAVDHFREADRLQAFAGPLLVEYFWAAQAVRAADAVAIGRRALAASPRETRVRDGLIGLAVAAGDEAAAVRLAEEGHVAEPGLALWMRRLAEGHLRAGRYRMAAQQFLAASGAAGAEAGDRAQVAFCLELAGDKAAAARAWSDVPDTLSSSRRDWTESRARALAPAPAPPVWRAGAPAPTGAQVAAAERRRLVTDPCAGDPLDRLERLGDGQPFIAAVAARPSSCPEHAAWTARAVERAIAAGDFEQALALAHPVATQPGAMTPVREQYGVLLHWTGRDVEALPVLRGVVADAPGPSRAATALVEAWRAAGDSEAAWALAEVVWRRAPEASLRVGLAELALETGRADEALALARGLEADDVPVQRAAAVAEGAALLALGRPAEARRVLEPLLPDARAGLGWLDAVAWLEGVPSALRESGRWPIRAEPAWSDVLARRAVWQVHLGDRAGADQSLALAMAADPVRGRLAAAEVALAARRPAEAERTFRAVLLDRPQDVRAIDGLSTALAEQGRWDEALATLGSLRERRPADARWAIRAAEWRHRQAPSPETLRAVADVAGAHALPEGRRALARAHYSSGQFQRAATMLGDPSRLAEPDRLLVARSLRAMDRPGDALAVLRAGPVWSAEALLLTAELEAALNGPAAVAATFAGLTSRADAEPDWFLVWAGLQTSGTDRVRVLEQGAARFPGHAALQERLAVAAWAVREADVALRAADRALAADPSRTGAWFVRIELASAGDRRVAALWPLLDRFEAQFGVEADARVGMAEMLAGLSRAPEDPVTARALAWMDAALTRDPQQVAARVARARLLAARGQTSAALSAVDALVEMRPDLPAAWKLRAELLSASGRYADAVHAYDRYLETAPDDLAARRQQARVEGWRGAYEASQERYGQLREREPDQPVVAAEVEAKRALYGGAWIEAATRYDHWLTLDPADVEAQLERAQLFDRLGYPEQALGGFEAVSASAGPHDVARAAAERIERRRGVNADVFANGQSADAAERQQLLDLVDSGLGVADDLGLGHLTRARLFGGPSWAQGEGGLWSGYHVGVQVVTAIAAPLRVKGAVAYRALGAMDASWFGDLGVTWRLGSHLRLAGGAERSLLLENASTLAAGIHGTGPTMSLRWTPGIDFSLDASGARTWLSDGNVRQTLRVGASHRVLRGRNELRLVGVTEGLAFQETRPDYFTPSAFWRLDGGAEWRGWLAMPRFFGDRERWVSAGYTFGVDDRDVRYHTARAGLSYELAGGVGVVIDGQLTRSAVYNAGRLSMGLRLKQMAVPEP
jgi:tetratricopeptide (TPR) repeat protein